MKKRKIIVGFSGGVDSCVAAYLLKNQGFEVIGVTFVVNNDWYKKNGDYASKAASQIGIQHRFLETTTTFDNAVVKKYIDDISNGITHSPCPHCNCVFKFEKLLEQAMLEGEDTMIATGHYGSVENIDGEYFITRGIDARKDQSYMLYRLGENITKKLILPLGGFHKNEIRGIAKENGVDICDRDDSQGLCFAPEGYESFIRQRLSNSIKPGVFTDKSGKILGEHNGFQFYTVGQRRGLGINLNKPLFIVDIKTDENRVILGEYDELYRQNLVLTDFVLHGKYKHSYKDKEFTLRPRFSSSGHTGSINITDGIAGAYYDKPNAENAPGQHLVVYDGNITAGGGVIKNTI